MLVDLVQPFLRAAVSHEFTEVSITSIHAFGSLCTQSVYAGSTMNLIGQWSGLWGRVHALTISCHM